jgi:hypothetical protein
MRDISRCALPACSSVCIEIRKFGFKTFNSCPFFFEKGAQGNVPPLLPSSTPTGVDLLHQVRHFAPHAESRTMPNGVARFH